LDKFMDQLEPKLLDTDGSYKLYYLKVEGEQIGHYLYMECPSTGRKFLEGVGDAEQYEQVDPTIKTCKDALQWRFRSAVDGLTKVTKKDLKNIKLRG